MTYAQFQQPPSPAYNSRPYVSAHTRARVVTVLLIVGAVISLLTIPSHILDMYVHPLTEDQEISDNPAGFLALALTGLLGLATFAVYIATVIVFLMWLYRVSNNVVAFGKRTLNSPGWAVGSFFVPIMNLFVPYQSVKDIWSKSEPTGADLTSYSFSPPGYFPLWWGFWIASNIASNIYFRLSLDEGTPVEGTALVGILSEVLSIVAALAAVQVVREIDRRQEERARTLQAAYLTPPPPPVFVQNEPQPAEDSSTPNAATSPLSEPAATTDLPKPSDSANPAG